MSVDIHGIMQQLPHRYPFLLVDRVLEMVPGERLVAIKNVTMNEPFFTGHFPSNPVMPGVLIVEAMAQAGGLLVHASQPDKPDFDYYLYLAGVDKARFRRAVVPGDQLRLEIEMQSLRSTSCKVKAEATVEGQRVASAELLSMLVPAPGAEESSS